MLTRTRSRYWLNAPCGLADAHAVVVEDDEQLPLERAGVVEAFECQAVDDGGIADDGDDVAVLAQMLIAAGHADGGGDGGAGVADGEEVVGAFAGVGNPPTCPFLRSMSNSPARPVSILCG